MRTDEFGDLTLKRLTGRRADAELLEQRPHLHFQRGDAGLQRLNLGLEIHGLIKARRFVNTGAYSR